MTKVFIGGSRHISHLCPEVLQRLDRIVDRRLAVLVGDANGADKAVQLYLHSRNYDLVDVFCAGDSCRNNVGHWPIRIVRVEKKKRDFSFYATKDRSMADEATVGLMIWDTESVGTLMNVLRLVRQNKKVVLFIAPSREFIDIRGEDDLARLIGTCGPELRGRVALESSAEFAALEAKEPIQLSRASLL